MMGKIQPWVLTIDLEKPRHQVDNRFVLDEISKNFRATNYENYNLETDDKTNEWISKLGKKNSVKWYQNSIQYR